MLVGVVMQSFDLKNLFFRFVGLALSSSSLLCIARLKWCVNDSKNSVEKGMYGKKGENEKHVDGFRIIFSLVGISLELRFTPRKSVFAFITCLLIGVTPHPQSQCNAVEGNELKVYF